MKRDVEVSIVCTAYNHQDFIEDAINSFLNQKTNFAFEIWVNDDCSTDKTPAILDRLQKENPDIIHVVFQKENQYSKHEGPISARFLLPNAKGKYIAVCEGDDFWLDNYKLQKQYDIMEKYPEVSFCFHDAQVVGIDKSVLKQSMLKTNKRYRNQSGIYTPEEIILLDFVPTASLFYRKSFYPYDNLPKYHFNNYCGDLPMRLTFISKGPAYYIDEVMSAYRTGNPNSASGLTINNRMKIAETMDAHCWILNTFDELNNYKFNLAISQIVKEKTIFKCVQLGDLRTLLSTKYRDDFFRLRFRTKLKCLLIHFFPKFFK